MIGNSRNGPEPPPSASPTIVNPAVSQPLAVSGPDASTPSSSSAEALLALRAQDEQRVRGVLQRYALAYERLDAKAAKAVWPNVDERALSRAFEGLQSQHIKFDRCDLTVKGVDARATCQGSATYIPKIGSKDPHTLRRQWAFALNRAEGGWLIAEAETR